MTNRLRLNDGFWHFLQHIYKHNINILLSKFNCSFLWFLCLHWRSKSQEKFKAGFLCSHCNPVVIGSWYLCMAEPVEACMSSCTQSVRLHQPYWQLQWVSQICPELCELVQPKKCSWKPDQISNHTVFSSNPGSDIPSWLQGRTVLGSVGEKLALAICHSGSGKLAKSKVDLGRMSSHWKWKLLWNSFGKSAGYIGYLSFATCGALSLSFSFFQCLRIKGDRRTQKKKTRRRKQKRGNRK